MALRRKKGKSNKKRIREKYYVRKLQNRRNTCKKRGIYKTEEEAQLIADEYNEKHLFADMRPYWCRRHQSFHTGHWNKHNQDRGDTTWNLKN